MPRWDDILKGTNGNDVLSGGSGDDFLQGRAGDDLLDGGDGNDMIHGDSGHDSLRGGEGDDDIDGGDGVDTAYYTGSVIEYIYAWTGENLFLSHAAGTRVDGNDWLRHVERLAFADALIDLRVNNAPIAFDDFAATDEDVGTFTSGAAGVLANDFDWEHDPLTVTPGTLTGAFGTLVLNADGTYSYAPFASNQALAQGESVQDSFTYTVSDGSLTDTGTLTIVVAGVNDAPVANPDSASTDENAAVLIDVLANDTDIDHNATLTVTAASAPDGQGTASVDGNQVRFDPGSDFDSLAEGESATVQISYSIADEFGATSSSTVDVTVTGTNDGPVANPDSATTSENDAVLVDVLANDTDVDNGAVLTVTAASAPAGQGTASVDGNQVLFDPESDFEHLAVGASATVTVSYDIVDEHGAASASTIEVEVTGTNDGPVANPDSAATAENDAVLIDVVANDTDVDDGAVLTVVDASAPAGEGSATIVGNQVQFDPGTDFDHLAVGATATVIVSYTIEDEHGASASSTIEIIVTGTNDGPVANPDVRTTSENSAVTIDVLTNDTDADDEALLTVTGASVPAGQGSVTIVENAVRFDPGTDFDHLASGESVDVVVSYTIEDEYGAASASTVTITVNGRDEGTATTGTDEGETLTGTDGDDTIDALGGDDSVFGLAGNDLITGGDGNDQLFGEEDDDVIDGGADNDFVSGGEGNDQLSGEAGNDTIAGEDGDDQLSGGDGFDTLSGDSGDDVMTGGNDDDLLFGGEGDDQLSGQSGNDALFGDAGNDQLTGATGDDALDGGDGDDTLSGGDGHDFLGDQSGVNSFSGGPGDDQIVAGSAGGAQTIDGGDGDDTIRHYYRYAASTITTGSGRDTIEIVYANTFTDPATAIVVTDFTAGAGGDVFALTGPDSGGALLNLLEGWDGSTNPFGAGFLRLTQSGADTLLEWDQDGSGTAADWQPLVVFQNTDVGDFTDDNFTPGYNPDGSAPAGVTVTGTNDDDTLNGTIGSDTIDALGGNDVVSGGPGGDTIAGGDGFDTLSGEADNDLIEGGNDDDLLWGGGGNDQLAGQAGNDALFGEDGNDSLDGGGGDDSLDGGDGDDALVGGDGDDFLSGGLGANLLSGGGGNDLIVADASGGAQTVDGGDGDDTVRIRSRSAASAITTGSGRDTIELLDANLFSDPATAIIVTDFTPGAGGDLFRLSGGPGALLDLLSGWDGSSNPFGSGFLRLTQSGADTLLEWDQDGSGDAADWQTLVVFQNTDAGDFTDANFTPSYAPDGSEPAGQTIVGTAAGETLTGTIGGDTIDALGGDDSVNGGGGGDTISGGDGVDFLRGEADNDVIDGGNDDDFVFGGDGNDQLAGQAGNDALFGENGDDSLDGGDGDDSLDGGEGSNTLDGGDGNDFLSGGLGSDVLTGGAGNDSIRYSTRNFAGTIATGSGIDTIELLHANVYSDPATVITVTDFTAGVGGDLFRLGGEEGSGALLTLLSGWDGTSNPFGAGFLRLTQSGADTLLEWDQDGSGSTADWQTIVVFQNTDAGDFTDANFTPGYDPNGSAPAGETIVGTNDGEMLTGTIGGDTIDALGGDDFVMGGGGADLIRGGNGLDSLLGQAGNDVLEGGDGDDILFGGDGDDQLSGQVGSDIVFGENGADQLSGAGGDDNLEGGEGDDTLDGGDGNDVLSGGGGSDVLTGAAGADLFDFQSAAQGPDEITDFVSGLDTIRISASGFGGGLTGGGTVSLVTGSDPTATAATGQFLYDSDDGRLLWDEDGTGSGDAVLVATLTSAPPLAASDFTVI